MMSGVFAIDKNILALTILFSEVVTKLSTTTSHGDYP
jgi:hypothetical protein